MTIWSRWKALVTENSKMSSSGSFSLVPQPELPESTKKGQKCADFGVFENKMANYWLWTSGNVVALGKMTLRMTFLNSL